MGSDSGFLLICVCAWGGWTIQPPFLPPNQEISLGLKKSMLFLGPRSSFPLGSAPTPKPGSGIP